MAKITIENLRIALESNNTKLKKYVQDTITNFSPTATNVAKIMSHLSNTSIHVTHEDKELWDSMYDKAITYIDKAVQKSGTIELKIVDTLPTTNISKNAFYLLRTDNDGVYEQYVYSNNKWVSLGATTVNLDQFYTKEEVNAFIDELKSSAQHNHQNKEILDLVTAAFTIEEKRLLSQLSMLDTQSIHSHVVNEDIHVSTEEKDIIESIKTIDLESIKEHLTNKIIHITPEDRDNWNNILNNAKEYTDNTVKTLCMIKNVDAIPENPDKNTIYIMPAEHPSTNHIYDKFIFIDGNMESIGGSTSSDAEIVNYITQSAMELYVSEHTHTHENKSVLDSITEAFTTELLTTLRNLEANDVAEMAHVSNNNIPLSTDQIDAINSIKNIENTIENTVAASIRSELSQLLSLNAIYVDSLPVNKSDISTGSIYFVRKSPLPSKVVDDEGVGDVSEALLSSNYDKYIWSSEYECWERVTPDLYLADGEIDEILSEI